MCSDIESKDTEADSPRCSVVAEGQGESTAKELPKGESRAPSNSPDLTGRRFGRLIVISKGDPYVNQTRSYVRWDCRCDCGANSLVTTSRLLSGKTRSCGCKRKETTRTHGQTVGGRHSPTYNTWQDMIDRCTNPNDPAFSNYGGRGIRVCDRWRNLNDFIADMGPRPPRLTIDRIDNDKGYEPGNCRWATRTEQNRNTRATKLTADIVRQIRASSESSYQWSKKLGVSYTTVKQARNGATWRDI